MRTRKKMESKTIKKTGFAMMTLETQNGPRRLKILGTYFS